MGGMIGWTERGMAADGYSFRKATPDDLDLLGVWRSRPHVREWWEPGEPSGADALADPRVARWIVSLSGRPFAFLQDYTVHGWDDHHFAGLPEGTRGIDQYIGEPGMIELGHGAGFIGARAWGLCPRRQRAGSRTDPHPDNAGRRAIAVRGSWDPASGRAEPRENPVGFDPADGGAAVSGVSRAALAVTLPRLGP